jgi:hypothetical protein
MHPLRQHALTKELILSIYAKRNPLWIHILWRLPYRCDVYKIHARGECTLRSKMQFPPKLVLLSLAWVHTLLPITVARSNAGVVCSNPTQGMDVSVLLFCVCLVLYVGSALATDWFVQGVMLTVCRIKKLKKRSRSSTKDSRALDRQTGTLTA